MNEQNPSPGDIKIKRDAYSRRLLRSADQAFSRRLIRSPSQSFNRRLLRSTPTYARRILRASPDAAFSRRLIRSSPRSSQYTFRRRLLRSGSAYNRRLIRRSDPTEAFKRRIFKKSDPDVAPGPAMAKRQSLIPFPRTGKRSGSAPGPPADGDREIPESIFQVKKNVFF